MRLSNDYGISSASLDYVGDDPGDEDFPEEIEASQVASWQQPTGSIFVAHTHEDSGLPFRLVVVVDLAPPELAG